LHEEFVDGSLRQTLFGARSSIDQFGAGLDFVKQLWIDQIIVEHDVCLAQNGAPFQREQARISGPSSHQVHLAAC
jgi:hypothetical protein